MSARNTAMVRPRPAAVLMAALAVAAIGIAPAAAQDAGREDTYTQLNVFGDAFERVRRAYVEEVADQTLIRAAINGLLAALDPHSSFMTAEQYEEIRAATGHGYDGLGVEVTMSQGVVQVIAALDNSPAAAADLQPGDLIVDINRTPVYGMNLPDAIAALKGEPGSDVELLIVRQGVDAFMTTAVRAPIPEPTVRAARRGTEGYIRIPLLTAAVPEAVTAAVAELAAARGDGFDGIVLDLRSTPGGSTAAALQVADLLLDGGEMATVRGRDDEVSEAFTAEPGDILSGRPVVVLVDGGTAAAAEVLAGALKGRARALVVGVGTFGLGSRQTIVPLEDAGFVQLTTGFYWTPDGAAIHRMGIEPDLVVEQSRVVVEEARFPRRTEAVLRGALDVPEESGEVEVAELSVEDDYQLARALDLLRALALMQRED
jgi:carboxyl-terminal processing protease